MNSFGLSKLTFLQPIEARRNRRLGVVLLGREDVAEEGVFVCDQRRLESRLGVLVVLEGDWSGHCSFFNWFVALSISTPGSLRLTVAGNNFLGLIKMDWKEAVRV